MIGYLAEIPVCGELDEEAYAKLEDQIATALQDEACFALVLVFKSCGGCFTTDVPRIGDMIFSASKPVYGYIPEEALSAAYWIASQCRAGLVAYRAASVGSIGVVVSGFDKSEKAKSQGLRPVVIRSVPDKALGQPGEVIDDHTMAVVQKSVNDADAIFRADIARARPQIDLTKQTGLVYFAAEALALGLVDSIENYSDFLSRIVQPAQP